MSRKKETSKKVLSERKEKHKKYVKEWVLKNPEKVYAGNRDWVLRKKFGITLSAYLSMKEGQDGKCIICKIKSKRNLCVDHDHKTGEIRGLLCLGCNTGLGNFKDNVNILSAAIKYLNKD